MKKKLLCAALSALLLASLSACGQAAADSSSPGEAQYLVGICQQMRHESLDTATEGFKDTLDGLLGEGNVEYIEQNAGGEQSNCTIIIDGFVSDGVDLILANATWPLQAAASATADIPVLGTSVTDYATALGIEDWNGTVGGNISGTSDLAPLDQQADMLRSLFPDAENVGLLYCSSEPNSVYQIETVRGYLEEMGYSCTAYAFNDANDLASVTQTACDSSDVIYIPTDNTAATNTESIANVALAAGVPIVGGDSGICSGCGVATIAADYYELGAATARMAAQILTGEADISVMPVEYSPVVSGLYNAANCELLGITPPEGYEPIG